MRGELSKRLSFEESRNVALLMFTCIRMLLILIYVLYKSKSLTLITIEYSWIHSWDIFIEHCFWAQEAVCNQVIDVGTGFMKILYFGRAPRTKETLPDFREKCRVTRHSRALRGLTGSQRTPGFWGVTEDLLRDWTGDVLLSGDAFWVEEHEGHISEVSKQDVPETDRRIHGGIHR